MNPYRNIERRKRVARATDSSDQRLRHRTAFTAALMIVASVNISNAADLPLKAKPVPYAAAYDWTGAYAGGHLGYAVGNSNWNAGPAGRGSLSLTQPIDVFAEGGSFYAGLQAGYDWMLPNRMVIGVVGDVSFPAWPNLDGVAIGGSKNFNSPFGPDTYGTNVLTFGTLRGRVGYSPGNWLFYATGGVAWSYDQISLASATETPQLFRLGWAAGLGAEVSIGNNWTTSLEYLYTRYHSDSVSFPSVGIDIASNSDLHQVRWGLNYRFGDGSGKPVSQSSVISPDMIAIMGQATFTWQGYPSIHSRYEGPNSLPARGTGKETFDTTIYAGIKLWKNAEFWFNPEIDQGFGIGNTHGAAGYFSGESYKLGAAYPYARIQRAFLRQTINFDGETEKVAQDINQFAATRSTNRLVLTVGRFGANDMFDTNKFANNPKTDFLNWSLINTGTFDYAADAWGYTYGAAAEYYFGRWTVRGGVFDLSATPAGGDSPSSYGLDPKFKQLQALGEVERRYDVWGQQGAVKVTGFVSHGAAGSYADAIALAALTGQPADITAVRRTKNRTGVSMNIQQDITDSVGVFMRAGWSDGKIEPWDFSDIDQTIAVGSVISGKLWGRPDDTIGVAGVVNHISKSHADFFNAGGLGILIGDGILPRHRPEQLLEAYYSYALNSWAKLTLDYQHMSNPGYNPDRGPVNAVAVRVRTQF